MAFNNEKFFNLDYTHDELEFLLDKINNGNVLSDEQYEKLIKIELDNISSFSGDYNDLINKPDFISEVRNSIETLNLETSDSVEQKLNLLRTNIIDVMQSFLAAKAEKNHTHYISEVSDLSSALNTKADFFHTHTQYDDKIKQLEDAIEDVASGNIPMDLTNLVTKDMFEDSLKNKANKGHLHTIDAITGLQEELDNKFNKDETFSKSDINSLLETKTNLDHNHDDIYYTKNEANGEFLKVEEYLEDVVKYVTNDKLLDELSSKSGINHDHNTAYYTKEEIDKTIADVVSNGQIDLTVYAKKVDVDAALIEKADREHAHDISNIDNLQDILNSKLELKDIQETIDNKANKEHIHAEYVSIDNVNALLDDHKQVIEEGITQELLDYVTIENLNKELDLKSDITHNHDTNYSQLGHEHNISNISELQNELDSKINKDVAATKNELKEGLNGKSDITHMHDDRYYTIEQVDTKIDEGVGTIDLTPYAKTVDVNIALAGKADTLHGHNIADIYYLQSNLDSKINKNIAATKTELKEGLDSKSDVTHRHDDDYAPLQHNHSIEDIEDIKDNFYIKSEVNNLLNQKANIEHTHDISEIDKLQEELEKKALKSDVYTKKEIEEQMAGKSDKDHLHDDRYYTQEQVDDAIEESIGSIDLTPYATTEYVNTELSKKSNIDHTHDDTYSKLNHEHKVENITDLFDNVYSEDEINDLLTGKSNIDHTHDDVYSKIGHDHIADDITDLYDNIFNKKQITDLLSGKSDIGHGHKIEEIENLQSNLDLKANVEDVYVKTKIDEMVTDINAKIDTKANADHAHDDVYSKLNHGHKADEITDLFDNVYKESEVDTLLAGKSDTDHKHDGDYATLDHKHEVDDLTDLFDNVYKEKEVDDLLTGKSDINHKHDEDYAALGHKHKVDEITDLFDNVYSEDEINDLLTGKSDINHKHDEDYAALDHKHEVDEITDLFDNVYKEKEVDDLLSTKSDVGHGHKIEEIEGLNDKLESKADMENIYNKEQINSIVSDLNKEIDSKASVDHSHDISEIDELQDELNKKADATNVYSKTEINEVLAGKSDKDHAHDGYHALVVHSHNDLYYTEDEINTLLEESIDQALILAETTAQNYTNTKITDLIDSAPEAMNTLNELASAINEHQGVYEAYIKTVSESLAGKSDKDHAHDDVYYTKAQVEEKIEEGTNSIDLTPYAKIEDIVKGYSPLEHKHESSEITDLQSILDAKIDANNAATKEEFDALVSLVEAKADANHDHDDNYSAKIHKHTISEIEDLLDNVYTENEVNSLLSGYSQSNHDHKDLYYTKTEIDENIKGKIDGIDFSTYATKDYVIQGYSPLGHSHEISNINNLQTSLDLKANASDTATKAELKELSDTVSGKADSEHAHDQSEITGLKTNLEAINNSIASAQKDIADINTSLATKSDSNHIHKIEEITNLQESLNSKINADIAATKEELTSGLAGKAESEHQHEISDIKNLGTTLESKANAADVYTKTVIEEKLAAKLDATVKQEIDAAIDLKLDKADISMMTKEIIDNAFDSITW